MNPGVEPLVTSAVASPNRPPMTISINSWSNPTVLSRANTLGFLFQSRVTIDQLSIRRVKIPTNEYTPFSTLLPSIISTVLVPSTRLYNI